jgi:integrase
MESNGDLRRTPEKLSSPDDRPAGGRQQVLSPSCWPETGSSELLLVRNDRSPWPHAYACDKLKILRRELGLSDDIVFHTLRHTYASLLLEAGAAPLIVARQLGHATMQTVINTYAHLTDDFIDLEFRRRFRPGFIEDLDLGGL